MKGVKEHIAGYEVLATIGYGARSTIYAVQHPKDGQVFALKRVLKQDPQDQRFIDQTVSEHEVAGRVEHPNLRRTYRLIRRRNLWRTTELLLVMELIDGISLEQQRPPTLTETVAVFKTVADAVGAMHKAGYVHADLKPSNVLLHSDGQVKIIDFGQSCRIGTVKQRIQGTPDYIAPEQVERGPITPQTDVFNLGATMYWCLTNQHVPTRIPTKQDKVSLKGRGELKAPQEVNPELPNALNGLILDCLESDPVARPESMSELAGRLDVVLHQIDRMDPTTAPAV